MEGIASKALAICGHCIVGMLTEKLLSDLTQKDLVVQRILEALTTSKDLVNQKFEADAKADVLLSLTCLQEGFCLLSNCGSKGKRLQQLIDQYQLYGRSQRNRKSASPGKICKSSSRTKGKMTRRSTAQSVSGLSVTGYTNQETDSFREDAKRKFCESETYATRSFHNDNLRPNDRIFAAKLKIVATISKHIEHPHLQMDMCLITLKQLNEDKAVIANFKTEFVKKKQNAFKKKWYIEERNQMICSVVTINRMLFSYARSYELHETINMWPHIDLGEKDLLHPVRDKRILNIFPTDQYDFGRLSTWV